jgi:hypothetical protein
MKRFTLKLICASLLFSVTAVWGDNISTRAAGDSEASVAASIADVDSSLFFTLDGKTRFYTGRSTHAQNLEGYESQFDIAQAAGEKIIRVSLMTGNSPARFRRGWATFFQTGDPHTEFLESWDRILDAAYNRGLHACVMLDAHAFWKLREDRTPSPDSFRRNIFRVRIGPTIRPIDIATSDALRQKYIQYVQEVTRHFSKHKCIFVWETFCELNVPYRVAKASDNIAHSRPQCGRNANRT